MSLTIINQIKNILSEIEYHDKKYHDEDDPEISDDEYDRLCKNYDQLIKENQNYDFLIFFQFSNNLTGLIAHFFCIKL